MSRIAIIGTGYVGLTCGACFAHLGHDVVCVDVDPLKVERLSKGIVPIVEHGLEELVTAALHRGNLRFVLGAVGAVEDREFVFLCVPTPQGDDGSADLTYIQAAARQISTLLAPGAVVVNKSTVPVGSAGLVASVLLRDDVSVVSNPEFLREGTAVADFLHPDRVVVGSSDPAAGLAVAGLYSSIEAPVVITDPESAETIKYAANAFLATKLSFVNAIASVCEGVGANIFDVLKGMGLDKRIGPDFLHPGPGWGGSCFPKDTRALQRIALDVGYEFDLLDATVAANEQQFSRTADKVRAAAGGSLRGVTVAVWGLTFKAGTDDLRDSPSLSVVRHMLADGATVRAFDPAVSTHTLATHGHAMADQIAVFADPYEAATGAAVLAVLTEWPEFRLPAPDRVGALMATRAVVDARNVLDRAAWQAAGFQHTGVGYR
jgi:UDPglucose 6-dehydrogenase